MGPALVRAQLVTSGCQQDCPAPAPWQSPAGDAGAGMESEPPTWGLLQLHLTGSSPSSSSLLSPAAGMRGWVPKAVALWCADNCFIQLHH